MGDNAGTDDEDMGDDGGSDGGGGGNYFDGEAEEQWYRENVYTDIDIAYNKAFSDGVPGVAPSPSDSSNRTSHYDLFSIEYTLGVRNKYQVAALPQVIVGLGILATKGYKAYKDFNKAQKQNVFGKNVKSYREPKNLEEQLTMKEAIGKGEKLNIDLKDSRYKDMSKYGRSRVSGDGQRRTEVHYNKDPVTKDIHDLKVKEVYEVKDTIIK